MTLTACRAKFTGLQPHKKRATIKNSLSFYSHIHSAFAVIMQNKYWCYFSFLDHLRRCGSFPYWKKTKTKPNQTKRKKKPKTQMGALEQTIYHFQQKLEFTEIFARRFSPFVPFWNLKSIFSIYCGMRIYHGLKRGLSNTCPEHNSLFSANSCRQTPSDHLKRKNIIFAWMRSTSFQLS